MPLGLPQRFTLWTVTGRSGTGGKTYSVSREDGRAASVSETLFNDDGKEIVARKAVYLTAEVSEGDYIAEGEYFVTTPDESAKQVVMVSVNPTMSNLTRALTVQDRTMATRGFVTVKVTGMRETLANLSKAANKYEGATEKALETTGELIRLRSVAKTPVDSGDLVGSSYATKTRGVGIKRHVWVGYKAPYAGAVHESREEKLRGQKRRKAGSRGTYWSPSGESAFLEKAAYQSVGDMRRIFKKAIRDVKIRAKRR